MMDWSFRMMLKASPWKILIGMMDTDHVPTAHVSGSLQVAFILHELITFSMLGRRSRHVPRCMSDVWRASKSIA